MNETPASAVQTPAQPGRKLWHAGSLIYTAPGLFGLFFWVLGGDFSFNLKDRSVPKAMQLLLHQFHVSNFVAGILMSTLPAAIGFLVSPTIAYHSDRHRGRWGRRIPFLIAPVPFAFAAMLGLAFTPAIGREMHRLLGHWGVGENTCIVAVLAASWTLFDLSSAVCNTVFLSLITDVVPREVIGRFFALFRVVGLIAAIIFGYYILGRIEQHYVGVFVGIGLVYCVSFTVMCFKVKEGPYPPPPPPIEGGGGGVLGLGRRFVGGARNYCRECFTVPYYRWIFLSITLVVIGTVPIGIFDVAYAKSLNMSMTTLGKYGALQALVSLLQAYPVGWLADRFHPLRLTIIAILVMSASTFAALFFVHNAASFGVAYVLCGSLAGFYGTAYASVPTVLFPKLKFAVFNTGLITVYGIGAMVAGPVCGWMLDLLHNQYRYIYLWWGTFNLLAFFAMLVVYQKFVHYGGAKNYVAPE